MGSYNRLNGRYVCQSPDLLDLPRQWGWGGVSLPPRRLFLNQSTAVSGDTFLSSPSIVAYMIDQTRQWDTRE